MMLLLPLFMLVLIAMGFMHPAVIIFAMLAYIMTPSKSIGKIDYIINTLTFLIVSIIVYRCYSNEIYHLLTHFFSLKGDG